MKLLILWALSAISCYHTINDEFEAAVNEYSVNYRPIVCVISQPAPWKHVLNPENNSYIAASYVKYIESSGARVVPMQWNLDINILKELMDQCNGFFIPGGGTDLIFDPRKVKT